MRPLLEHDDDFFLVNGDTIQFPPFDALRDARRERKRARRADACGIRRKAIASRRYFDETADHRIR